MSDDTKPASADASTSSPSTDNSSKSTPTDSSSSAAPSNGDSGKSARESVGGAAVGHYGFFSNIKTPEYKSGWDDIWGNRNKKPNSGKSATRTASRTKSPRGEKNSLTISLDVQDLPDEVQVGLEKAARAKFKGKRINYDNRKKTGAISWRIDCNVKR